MPVVPDKPWLFKNRSGKFAIHFAGKGKNGSKRLKTIHLDTKDEDTAKVSFKTWQDRHPKDCPDGVYTEIKLAADIGAHKPNGRRSPEQIITGKTKHKTNLPAVITPKEKRPYNKRVIEQPNPVVMQREELLDQFMAMQSSLLHGLAQGMELMQKIRGKA